MSFWSCMFRRPALDSLVKVIFLFLLLISPSLEDLVLPPSYEEVMSRFTLYYVLWRTHWPFSVWCSFHHQYSLLLLVLCSAPPFASSVIQIWRSMVQAGSPFVGSSDVFSGVFFESMRFCATPTMLVHVNPWHHWFVIYLKCGGCCIYSNPWTLTVMMKITCLCPTLSSWYTYST